MNRHLLTLTLCLGAPAFAAVDGTVINETTGKPQPNAILQLVQPGAGGMQTLGSAKSDAEGKFKFDTTVQGPTLVQAIYGGVLYTKMIPPGTPSSGLQIPVFEASKDPKGAKVAQHFFILQPSATQMNVSETFIYQGDSKVAFNDPKNGTLRFYLPANATEPKVTIEGPAGMPIQRSASKTGEANLYKVDYAVKPGETRFDVNYSIPGPTPMTFSSKLAQKEASVNVVAPNGVTIKGDELELLGQEPKTQASIYKVKGDSFKIDVEGTGSMQAAAGGGEDNGGQPAEDTGAPALAAVNPRVYDHVYWIIGIAFAVLGLSSFLLYQHGDRAS